MRQIQLLKKEKSDFGGDLSTTRKGRSRPRPISVRHSMHLVLRSTQAVGSMSFKRHNRKIRKILGRFAEKHAVQILSQVNVGNHLHLQIKLFKRQSYKPFIRAVTSAIMMAVTGVSRWSQSKSKQRFWDRRPFTRICSSFVEIRRLKAYFQVNFFESMGYSRKEAHFLVAWEANSPTFSTA